MPVVYLDTNIFIQAVEVTTIESVGAQDFLALLRDHPGAAVTSELTLAELIAPSRHIGRALALARRTTYFDLFAASSFIAFHPVTREVLIDTADLRAAALNAGRSLKLPDAIHIATAIRAKCRYLMSLDRRLGPLARGMTLLEPEPESIALVAKAFDA